LSIYDIQLGKDALKKKINIGLKELVKMSDFEVYGGKLLQ